MSANDSEKVRLAFFSFVKLRTGRGEPEHLVPLIRRCLKAANVDASVLGTDGQSAAQMEEILTGFEKKIPVKLGMIASRVSAVPVQLKPPQKNNLKAFAKMVFMR